MFVSCLHSGRMPVCASYALHVCLFRKNGCPDCRRYVDLQGLYSFRPYLRRKLLGNNRKGEFLQVFKNSVVVAILNVSLVTILNAMMGYALGLLSFKGKKFMISFIIALAIIPTESVIINRFMVALHLHMLNSYAGLALPTVGYPMFIFCIITILRGCRGSCSRPLSLMVKPITVYSGKSCSHCRNRSSPRLPLWDLFDPGAICYGRLLLPGMKHIEPFPWLYVRCPPMSISSGDKFLPSHHL